MTKQSLTMSYLWNLLIVLAFFDIVRGQAGWGTPQLGTVVLTRNGQYSSSYTSGRVVVYGVGTSSNSSSSGYWGNVCRFADFSLTEANVICHQLTYSGASSWSYASVDSFEVDTLPTLLDDVSCSTSSYLMLFQCSSSTIITSTCNDANDISVNCYSTRIWNSPFSGQIRLSGGTFSNEGLLEVYCNGQWGTVCDNTFTGTAASVVCRQLGYSQYYRYNTLQLVGTTSQSIWLNSLRCSSLSTCLSSCQGCPTSQTTVCVHAEDVTVICYSPSITSTNRNTNSSCPVETDSGSGGLSPGAIAGIVIGSLIGVGILAGIIIHLDKQKKAKAAARSAAARSAAAKSVQLTSVSHHPPATTNEPQPVSTTPPQPVFQPNPVPEATNNEKHSHPEKEPKASAPDQSYIPEPIPAPYNPTAPSQPNAPYPSSDAYLAYPGGAGGYYPPNPYPDVPYPPATNPGYPPYPANTGYPPPPPPGESDKLSEAHRTEPPPYYDPTYPPAYPPPY